MAIYMKYGDIDGAVTTTGFEKWIELSSFQWGVGRAIGTAARGAATREASEPSISEIVVTKRLDKASTKLFMDAVAGDLSATVKFKFTTTTKDKIDTFLAYELTNCGLSGYSISSGGDAPSGEPVAQFHQGHVHLHRARPEDRRLAGHRGLRPADDGEGLTSTKRRPYAPLVVPAKAGRQGGQRSLVPLGARLR